jgi:hypothetical protein
VFLVLKIILTLYLFPERLNFTETPSHVRYTQSPEASALYSVDCYPWNNDRVNETLRITVELNFTSQAANLNKQILSFLAYGRSSIVKTQINLFPHAADG